MSQFETLRKALFLALVLTFTGLSVSAQDQRELPQGVQNLIYAEQQLLSRDVNEARIMTPKNNKQEAKYKPENGETFEVKSYWMSADLLNAYESTQITPNLKKLFYKKIKGKDHYLLLVHPESASLYSSLTDRALAGPKFWATSTASSRTLVMWQDQRPDLPFFGKLSLNKEIGGVVRTIPKGEVVRSLGTTEVLYKNQPQLPQSFEFLPETLSLIPKGMDRGGMIIREIPEPVASGKNRFVPLFSLYASRSRKAPLLAEMIQESQLPATEFIEQRIIRPFVKQWMEMVLVHGISMEPHAQNVLIGLDAKGMPNGQFLHRDFGGFNMDFKKFSELKTLLPVSLPIVTTFEEDYHQKFTADSINASLRIYFEEGFVYNLNEKLPTWVEKGWIPEYRHNARDFNDSLLFSKMIYKTIAEELARYSLGKVQPTLSQMRSSGLETWIEMARKNSPYMKNSGRCEAVFN